MALGYARARRTGSPAQHRTAARRRGPTRAPTVRNEVATIRTEKTGVELYIPILPALKKAITIGPTGDLTFICGANGRPMVKESFGNFFKKAATAAKVEGSAHGLRKLAATMIADRGGSENELRALFGWKTNELSSVYTRNANKKRLALQAAMRLADSG